MAELKQQFDILPVDGDWSGYRMLVLIDPLRLDERSLQKVRAHLADGGTILATGSGGLLAEEDAFPAEWGVDYLGPETLDPGFLAPGDGLGADIPQMPLKFELPGVQVRQRPGTEVLAQVVEPYFNRHWDGFHGHVYTPPHKDAGRPAITRCGPVIHAASSIFGDYAKNANPIHRAIVGAALKALVPDPLVLAPGLPSFARVTLTAQEHRTMVHLLSYVPELRGRQAEIVEEPILLRDVHISVLRPPSRRVYLAPQKHGIDWSTQDGRVEFTVPEVRGYQMVVLE